MFSRSLIGSALVPIGLAVPMACSGCGADAQPTMSKIVGADSDEGRKAQADDEAFRRLRHQQEAGALARRGGLKPPGKN